MSNPFSAVFDAIGSVAEFVVDNALPIIETVALNYFAPGLSSALGISELATKAIGNAAISAMNGGSIASIATAGIMPFINSPSFMKENFGINFNPSSFVSKPIADALGNGTIANVVASAAGAATMGGIVGGITGADIGKAALGAGLGSITSQALSKTWTTIQSNLPKLDLAQKTYQSDYNQVKDLIPQIQNLQECLAAQNDSATAYNDYVNSENFSNSKTAYESLRQQYDSAVNSFNQAKDANNASLANSFAKTANALADQMNNGEVGKSYQAAVNQANDLFKTYQADVQKVGIIQNDATFMNQLDAYKPVFDEMAKTTQQYDLLNNQTQADYSNFQMTDAISKGNYADAAKYYQDLQTYNQDTLKIDPNATTTNASLSSSQSDFLKNYSSAADPSQFNTQAADLFKDYKVSDPSTWTSDSTTATGTSAATTTTPSTTPTTTTPPPTTTNVSTLTPLAGKIVDAFGNAIKSGVISNLTGQIIGGITGTPTGPTTTPGVSLNRPAQHVDISTLKPFTGTLPANLQTSTNTGQTTQPAGGLTTPTNVAATQTTPTVTQPTTGGLNAITQPQNVVADTSTQTPAGGLQSTAQPQTTATSSAPKKVDVSTLTPVTDTNMLKNLGLQIG